MNPIDMDPMGAAAASGIVDTTSLRDRLNALARDGDLSESAAREAVIRLLKQTEQTVQDVVSSRLLAGMPGYQIARALSDYRDASIRALIDFAGQRAGAVHKPAQGLAVAAVGGYGRGTLAPHSDIDLLFLVPDPDDPWVERAIQITLYTLWDIGTTVGHATRTLDQCIELAQADMSIRTALLEARYVAGETETFRVMKERYWDEVATSVSDFVEAKLAERDRRHAQAGNSRYRVEPNIKDGKGGMRDLHTLFWIAKYVFRVDQPSDLVDAGLLSAQEFNTFQRCASFLWDVRCHLHALAGRSEERLTFDVQTEMARRLGYRDHGGVRAVEAFMKNYFLVAREVGALTAIVVAALEMQNAKGAPGRPWYRSDDAQTLKDWPGFVMEAGRVSIGQTNIFEKDPVNLIRLFEIADTKRCYIHPNALRIVARSLHLADENLRQNEDANAIFLKLLSDGQDPEHTLRMMNESGVLGQFVPDFGRVVAMMQFNMYHHFTVDEHLLRAIGEIDRILKGSLKTDFPRAHRVAQRIRSRRVLFVAILLHDIAKGREEDHSIAGERVARDLGPRLGLSPAEVETVAWLVRYHLILSDTAQRRDIYDPKTARDMAAVVQTRERLRLLFVLTIADIRAVGPTTWNDWKAQLLEGLYLEVAELLGGGEGAPSRAARVAEIKAALMEVLTGWSEPLRQRAVDRFEPSYWLGFQQPVLVRHARLLRVAERRKALGRPFLLVDWEREPDDGATNITVVTQDRPGLFALLTGALAASQAYPVVAKAFTTANGIALDVFEIQDAQGAPFLGTDRMNRLRRRILDLLDGRREVDAMLTPRRLSERIQAFSVPPQVFFDNEASETYTVVEVEHPNRPDLLFRAAAGLRDLGLSIGSAHCVTYGELAVDVFYVKDKGGLKLRRTEMFERIEARLIEALEAAR